MLRHDLLILTEEAQTRLIPEPLRREMEKRFGGGEWCLPGIVKRQEPVTAGFWQAGFSFPWFSDGRRVRMEGLVSVKEILQVITPYEAASVHPLCPSLPRCRLLSELCETAKKRGIKLGVYGSTALWLTTGYPYLHETSDLDVIIRPPSAGGAEEFCRYAYGAADRLGISLDLEIRLTELGDVKAKELFSDQKTVIVREIDRIYLFDRKTALEL